MHINTHTHGREPTVGRSGKYDKETITHLRKQSHIRTQRFTWFEKLAYVHERNTWFLSFSSNDCSGGQQTGTIVDDEDKSIANDPPTPWNINKNSTGSPFSGGSINRDKSLSLSLVSGDEQQLVLPPPTDRPQIRRLQWQQQSTIMMKLRCSGRSKRTIAMSSSLLVLHENWDMLLALDHVDTTYDCDTTCKCNAKTKHHTIDEQTTTRKQSYAQERTRKIYMVRKIAYFYLPTRIYSFIL